MAAILHAVPTAPLRALIYARVSHDKRNLRRSVAEQRAEGEADCAREGWQVSRVLTDQARSASRHATKRRDAYAEAKRMMEAGEVDVVVTWSASRAQRDLDAYLEWRDLCARHGVLWHYDGTTYDLTKRSDRFRTGLDALVAEDRADQDREAVMRAMRANAANGRPHGRTTFGYRRTYDDATGAPTGTQVVNEREAALVREAAARFLAGETTRQIALDYNARGIPSPAGSTWRLQTVRALLTNPAYVAVRVHRGEHVAGNWPPILDQATWKALQARFADPSRRTNRDRADLAHLLSGVARCGVCGGRMERQGSTRGRPSYVCRSGGHVSRSQGDLDAYVTEAVLEWLEQPDVEARVLATTDDPRTTAAVEQVTELRARLDAAVDQFSEGELSATMLGKVEQRLLPQIEAAERAARQSSPVPQTVLDAAGSGARATWDAWEAAGDVARMRDVVRAVVDVTVLPVGKGRQRLAAESVRLQFRF